MRRGAIEDFKSVKKAKFHAGCEGAAVSGEAKVQLGGETDLVSAELLGQHSGYVWVLVI